MTSAERAGATGISVVIATGIWLDTLPAAIESALSQSHRPREIAVVHDGSSKKMAELIASYPEVRSVLGGINRASTARNTGLAATSGDHVVFLDGRHQLLPGALETGISSLQRDSGYAFTYGRISGVYEPGHLEMESSRRVDSDHYLELVRGDYIGTPSVVMYRRWALDLVGGFDSSLAAAEDLALNLELSRRFLVYGHGVKVAALVQPRGHPSHLPFSGARASVALLLEQHEHVRGNPRHEDVLKAGLRAMAIRHGLVLTHQLRDDVGGSGARGTIRDVISLVEYAGFLLMRSPRALLGCLTAELVPWAARRWSMLAKLGPLSSTKRPAVGYDDGQQIRRLVHTTVPADATVLIYGTPDSELPELDGRTAERFDSAAPSGNHVAPQQDLAVTALTARRAQGARFMLIPRRVSWWFEHHDQALKTHLDRLHTRLWSDDHCSLYRLHQDDLADRTRDPPRILVAGHFSFVGHGATAGDVMARDILCEWLLEAGRPFDVALAPPFRGGVTWRSVRPERYSHVVFVCGPFNQNAGLMEMLNRFRNQRLVGVNLSMVISPRIWNPFDVLIERDSVLMTRPDLTFLSEPPDVPVIGVCLREHAHGTRTAEAAIRRLVQSREMATVQIDTRLDGSQEPAAFAPRSPKEVEALLGRVDVVLTTRLHGMVLALKNGVPVIAIDPGNDGRKIVRQAGVVGWPVAFDVHDVTDEGMQQALDYCLTSEAQSLAAGCATRARNGVSKVREQFMDAL